MPLITISQNAGCRGREIAQMVADQLEIELFDDIKLQQRAIALGFTDADLKGLRQTSPGFFERLFSKKPAVYMDLTAAVIYDVACTGEGVIIGHCSQLLLNEFNCALHVLISAPLAHRTDHFAKTRGVARETAQYLLDKRDREQKGYMQFACGLDRDHAPLYDLVLNTAKTSPTAAARLIVAMSSAEEMKSCTLDSMGIMQRMSLERRAHAVLLRADFDTTKLALETRPPGMIVVKGIVDTPERKEQLERVLKEIDQVQEVDVQVVVMAVPFH
jgi:cytidylate kinase